MYNKIPNQIPSSGSPSSGATGRFYSVAVPERQRMVRQCDIMKHYSTVLGERIAAFV
jgi:hypothetical protein